MFGLAPLEALVVVLWLVGVVAAVRVLRRGGLARGAVAVAVAFFLPVAGSLLAIFLAFVEWRSRSVSLGAREGG